MYALQELPGKQLRGRRFSRQKALHATGVGAHANGIIATAG